MAMFYLNIYVEICEIVIGENHLHEMINDYKYSGRVSVEVWFKYHDEIVKYWFGIIKMPIDTLSEFFDEG